MKTRTYKFNALLEVEWLDTVDEAGWLAPVKAMLTKACPCKSVGYFLNRDEKVLRMSSSIQVKDQGRGVIVIPWGTITNVVVK